MSFSTEHCANRSVLDYEDEQELASAVESLSVDEWVVGDGQANVEAEIARLSALKSLMLLDTDEEEGLSKIAAKVRSIYDVSWAGLSLVDLDRQRFKAFDRPDIEVRECRRSDSFCAYAILGEELLVVGDMLEDERFRENPRVVGFPHFRFYAGAPLITPDGHKIGTLCLLDHLPRPQGLSKSEQEVLTKSATALMHTLMRRKHELVRRKESLEAKRDRTPSFVACQSPKTVRRLSGENKRFRPDSPVRSESPSTVIPRPVDESQLPQPQADSSVDPDKYLVQLTKALTGVEVKVQNALDLQDFFPTITDEQMARYKIEIVTACRENKLAELRAFADAQGSDCLDCFNRFGEGLLNMACRRGFTEVARYLLEEIQLTPRIRDDYGRTPMHDACWNPEPQLDICKWIMAKDPSLFLVADKRGYTPFQYARQSDWHIWRQFLFDQREYLTALAQPELAQRFSCCP